MQTITITITTNKEVNLRKCEPNDDRMYVSDYARFFDESCKSWTKDPERNRVFLRQLEQYATDRLKACGYLFLNDVYEMLGIARTKVGQLVGWVYDANNPIGDNYVDFDIYSSYNDDFVNGYKATALLDFNVDGVILDKI